MATSKEVRAQYPELTETMSTLSWAYPFWSTLLYDMMKLEVTEDLPTMGVGGGKLMINIEFFRTLTAPKRLAAFAHEIGHEMFFHPAKMKEYEAGGFDGEPFDWQRYNFAADYVINDMLKQMKVGELDEGWLWSPHISYKEGVEEVYRRLKPKTPPPSQSGSCPEDGDGDGKGQPAPKSAGSPQYDIMDDDGKKVGETPKGAKCQDEHAFDEESPHTEMEWKTATSNAHESAKAMGKGSAEMDQFIDGYIDTKRNWEQIFRDFFVKQRGRDRRNYKKIHKRRLHQYKMVMPTKHSHKIGKVGVIFDVSGSVSMLEKKICKSVIAEVLLDCRPQEMRCVCVAYDVIPDSDVIFKNVSDFEGWQPRGTGGTDMEAGFRYFEKDNYIPHVCIVLTDGHTAFTTPPPFPVIWISTQLAAKDYPYGSAVLMDVNQ